MDIPEKPTVAARRLGRERLRARRRRVARIRRRVAILALVAFLLAWGAIFTRLAAGRDPALTAAAHRKARSAQVSQTAPAKPPVAAPATMTAPSPTTDASGSVDPTAGSDPSAAGSDPSAAGSATSDPGAAAPAPAPVTTQQS